MAAAFQEREENESKSELNKKENESKSELNKRMQELQKEAFQLANYYFVFQGVIFTAFYNSSASSKCHFHWLPFLLSLLAGILNLSALLVIAYKYKKLLDKRDKELLQKLGVQEREPFVIKCARARRHIFIAVCMVLFVGFFFCTLYGCWKIPCRSMDSFNIDDSKIKCVKVCDNNNCISICQQN